MVDHKKSIKNKSKIVESKVSKDLSTAYKKYANGFNRPSLLLNLEQRMMFDGAAPIVADEIIDNTTEQSPESLPEPTASSDTEAAEKEATETTDAVGTQEESADVDGIADSLEVGDENSSDTVTSEEASDALALDGADTTATPLFGSDATPIASETPTSSESESEQATEVEDDSDETISEAESEEAEEAVEEPEVNRVVFIDTSVAGFEELLSGVIAEVESGSEETASELITDTVALTESSDADAANLSTAPPATDDVVSNSTQVASSDLGATSSLEDGGYIANEDGAIIVDGVAIYLLDPNDNQDEKISNTLADYTDLDAVDIISHGAAVELQSVNQRDHSETLSDHADDAGNTESDGDLGLEVNTGLIEVASLLNATIAPGFEAALAAGMDHDTDGDGILDAVDLDDDNDGILDVDEGSTAVSAGGAFNLNLEGTLNVAILMIH